MATYVFGSPNWWDGQGSNNGNWTDLTQWYLDIGIDSGKDGRSLAAKATTLPTQADTIWCWQEITTNIPATWSGRVIGLKVKLTAAQIAAGQTGGTWTGAMSNEMWPIRYYPFYMSINSASSTTPTITGTLPAIFAVGGNFTGSLINGNSYTFNSSTVTQNISGNTITLNIQGGTYNININVRDLNITAGTINGNINATSILTLGHPTTISATNPIINSTNNPQINCSTLTLGIFNSIAGLSTISTSGSVVINKNVSTISNNSITSIIAGTNITATDSTIFANLRSVSGTISLSNCTVKGNIVFTNIASAKLIIDGASVIDCPLSTASTNCANIEIYGGTFNDSNPWIFGSPTIAATTNIGAKFSGRYISTPPYYTIDYRVVTNKDITIYSSSDKTIRFNSEPMSEYKYSQGQNENISSTYNATMSSSKGIFTGLITILPITGGTMPTIIVRGGTYAPSKTVSFNSFSISAIPPDYGFNTPLVTQQITNGGIFQPKIYISDVPSRFDVLSTGGL